MYQNSNGISSKKIYIVLCSSTEFYIFREKCHRSIGISADCLEVKFLENYFLNALGIFIGS